MAPINRIAGYCHSPAQTRLSQRASESTNAPRQISSSDWHAMDKERLRPIEAASQGVAETHRLAGPIAALVGAIALGVGGLAASMCGFAVWAGYFATPTAAIGLAVVGLVVAAAATLLGYGALVAVAVASSQFDK